MQIEIAHWDDDRDELYIHGISKPRGEAFSNARGLLATKDAVSDFLKDVKAGIYDQWIKE